MNHYIVTFFNLKLRDIKIMADSPEEAKDGAITLAKSIHDIKHIRVKDVWLCTKSK